MSKILFLRHGPTDWNAAGQIQGHTDTSLSPEGETLVRSWCIPPQYAGWHCYASPLQRARQTAVLLGCPDPEPVSALHEMNWGAWEGLKLGALRQQNPADLHSNEVRGLDFRPPEGESPREVRERLAHWLFSRTSDELPAIAVCHKGLLRAALSLATDWDMTCDPPVKLQDHCAHCYRVSDNRLEVDVLNIPLATHPTE